jgi:hypothetical protein
MFKTHEIDDVMVEMTSCRHKDYLPSFGLSLVQEKGGFPANA